VECFGVLAALLAAADGDVSCFTLLAGNEVTFASLVPLTVLFGRGFCVPIGVRVLDTAGFDLTESFVGVLFCAEDACVLLAGRGFLVPIGVLFETAFPGPTSLGLVALAVAPVLFSFAGVFLTGVGVLLRSAAFFAGAGVLGIDVVAFFAGGFTAVFFWGCELCFVASATLDILSILATGIN
jgi:hypothetical protein